MVKPKKEQRILTDEEKAIKAQLQAHKAEEDRKKKEQERIDRIHRIQAHEEELCKANLRKIQAHWRKIMRSTKVQELRAEIHWFRDQHERQVARKDSFIRTLRAELVESEDQHNYRYEHQLGSVDGMLDLHHHRLKVAENEFQSMLRLMQSEFHGEEENIEATHGKQKKEMCNLLNAMDTDFTELKAEHQHQFDADKEEVKTKNSEEYNIMKVSLEGQIMDLERRIETAHQQYLASTEAKTKAYKDLSVKDAINSRLIEKRMKKLIHLHELLACWRAKIATDSKEWEAANTALRQEKEHINKHYQELKRSLDRTHKAEREKLKAISIASGEAMCDLKRKYETTERIIKLGMLNSKLESEHEKMFPFDILHCSTITLAASVELENVEAELVIPSGVRRLLEDSNNPRTEPTLESAHIPGRSQGARLEEMSNAEEDRAQMDLLSRSGNNSISELLPTLVHIGANDSESTDNIQQAAYAVNDFAEVVQERESMTRFNERFNKVRADNLNIEIERAELLEQHAKLQKAVEIYLGNLSVYEHTLTGPLNTLLIVRQMMGPSPLHS